MWQPLEKYLCKNRENAISTDINSILIKYGKHKNGFCPFNHTKYINFPIVVVKDNRLDKKYVLIANWGTFILRKIKGLQSVDVVILDEQITPENTVDEIRNRFIKQIGEMYNEIYS